MLSSDSCQGHRKGLVSGLLLWVQARKDAVCILWSEFSRGPYAR